MMKRSFSIVICAFFFLNATAQFKDKLPQIVSPKFKKDTLSVVKFGAVPDGNTLNTKSINATIEAMNKKGGGVVLVPLGLWLTGPVVLKSNVNLYLATG